VSAATAAANTNASAHADAVSNLPTATVPAAGSTCSAAVSALSATALSTATVPALPAVSALPRTT
jgi:hypothetical protein